MGNAQAKDGTGARSASAHPAYAGGPRKSTASDTGSDESSFRSASRPVSLPGPTLAIDVATSSPGGRTQPVPYKRPKGSKGHSSDSDDDGPDGEADSDGSGANSDGKVASKVGLSDFEPLKVIGNGCFGKVMMVRYKKNDKIYAMKAIRKAHVVKNKKVRHTQTERNIMQMLKHPYVMRLHYSFQNSGKLYMVMDYLNGGDIFYHLSVSRRFSEERARFYAAQVMLALECLHENKLVYRDLKPENVLTDSEGHVCLTDFGLSKEDFEAGSQMNTFVGTTEYLAPEVLKQKGYGKEVDWWSLGVLLFEMLTGCPPFYSKNRQMTFRMILSAELNVPEWLSQNARQIIRDLLVRDPSQRLGAGTRDSLDIRAHIFFSPIDFDAMMRKEIPPPYTPPPLATDDTSHFDSRFTAKPAVDSPTQSPEEPTPFEGFSYQSPTYRENMMHMHVPSVGDKAIVGSVGKVGSHTPMSIIEGFNGPSTSLSKSSASGSLGRSFGASGSLGKGSLGTSLNKSGGGKTLPRINSGECFSEQVDHDNDTVWVPNMVGHHEETEDGTGSEDGFEKLGTSLIQSSLADKSPRWREHDSQRGNVRDDDDDSSSEDDIVPRKEDAQAARGLCKEAAIVDPGGLQFGLDGIEMD